MIKKGDKVMCIDSDSYYKGLKNGQEYVIRKDNNNGSVKVEGLKHWYLNCRFNKIEPPRTEDIWEAVGRKPDIYDFINPTHYQKFSVEVIDMMIAIWGKEATALHCEMCAFKYRLRMGEKPNQPIEQDLKKVEWYLSKAKELRS